ncbi:MAG: hypothetical protein U0R44_02755 [Candidatus Micrarchaeia archaeon]
MVSLDIETIGPELRRIKIGQLSPDLLEGVLELAQEHGYEITLTSLSDLHFLFRIYQAEKVKEKKSLKKLRKAEDLILRLAGMYSLHHDAERRREERQKEDAERPRIRQFDIDEGMRIGKRMRELFESVGIADEKDMQQAVGLLGESKIEERVAIAKKTMLGDMLIRKVFSEHPETIMITRDENFLDELNAMEAKKGIIDAWSGAKNQAPPMWADYNESPSVLLVQFEVILNGLGIGAEAKTSSEDPERTSPGVPSALGGVKAGSVKESHTDLAGLEALPEPEAKKAMDAFRRSGGGMRGKLAALSELGIDVTKLSRVRESISEDTNSGAREQERFDSCIDFFFNLVVAKDLEGTINSCLGTRGCRIGKVGYLAGASGAFELSIEDGRGGAQRRVYLSMQDMEPAKIGRDLVEASGMVTHGIWTDGPSGAPLSANGRRYALSEDARDVGGRGMIMIRMPGSLRSEKVETKGAAMFREDIALRPEPGNDLHTDFYASMAEPAGRKEILRSLAAYFEMSRRMLLPDRRPPNTFLLRVRGADGNRRFTFQPTDMDGIGNFIEGKGGKADFSEFNNDFHKAAADFAVNLNEGMTRAARAGMIRRDAVPSAARIFSEFVRETGSPLPPDDKATVAERNRILRKNGGRLIGIGFDASQHVGSTIPSQGGRSVIENEDGRVLLDARRSVRTAKEAGTAKAQKGYRAGLEKGGLAHLSRLPAKAAEIAMLMLDAKDMPMRTAAEKEARAERLKRLRLRTGGEIAAVIAEDGRVFKAGGKDRTRIAELKARRIIFGKDSPYPPAGSDEPDAGRELTRIDR